MLLTLKSIQKERLQSLGFREIIGMTYAKEMDMRLGTWNVRILYGSESLYTVVRELEKYSLHLLAIHVRQDSGGTEKLQDYTFLWKRK
jgi:hypothetical protein